MTIHQEIAPADDQSQPVHFWNEVLAPKFIRFRHVLQGGLSRHSEAVFPELPIRSGDRILDVGCGFGDTALLLAERTGQAGEVVGMDCCDAFLDLARDDAERQGVGNVRFIADDVERGLDEGRFDFVFARFGTMFFANPVAGLRAMHASMKPGGGWRTSLAAAPAQFVADRRATSFGSFCHPPAGLPGPAGRGRFQWRE